MADEMAAGLALPLRYAARMTMRTGCGVMMLMSAWAVAACGGRLTSPAATPPAAAAASIGVQEYDALEKRVGDAFTALGKHLTARQGPEAAEAAETLAVALGEIERFWAQRRRTDAVKWAQDARTAATQAGGAVTAGDFATAMRTTARLEQTCAQCHRAYRELANGEHRIRQAAK